MKYFHSFPWRPLSLCARLLKSDFYSTSRQDTKSAKPPYFLIFPGSMP
jgi:hypothetical protein